MIKRIFAAATALLVLAGNVNAQTKKKTTSLAPPTTKPVATSYTLTGDISGLTADKMYIQYRDIGSKVTVKDSAVVVDGKFSFEGKVVHPMFALLVAEDQSFGLQMWLENSNIKVTGVSGQDPKVVGSINQDIMMEAREQEEVLRKPYEEKNDQFQKAVDAKDIASQQRLQAEIDDILGRQRMAFSEKLVKKYPNSYYVLNEVYNHSVMDRYNHENLLRFYNYLSPELKAEPLAQRIVARLEKLKLTTVGQPFPTYSQPDVDGKVVNVSDYKGKYLLLSFGAGQLRQYTNELPSRKKIYEQYKSQNLEMLDVLLEKNLEGLQATIAAANVPWKLVSDLKEWANPAVMSLAIDKVPQNFLIDPKGIIVAHDIFGDDLAKKLQQIIKK